MVDINVNVQIGLSPDTIAALDRLAAAFGRAVLYPSSLARSPEPALPEAPGGEAPLLARPPAEGPSRAAGQLDTGRLQKAPRVSSRAWLTPERKRRLSALYPTAMSLTEIRAELAALPGNPVPDNQLISLAASNIGLRRPTGNMPPGFTARHPGSSAPALAEARPQQTVEAVRPPRETFAPSPQALPAVAVATATVAPARPPQSRLETIRRVAAAVNNKAPTPPGEPIVASQETIRHWAAERGVRMDAFDLDAVNAKARAIGHREFALPPPRVPNPASPLSNAGMR